MRYVKTDGGRADAGYKGTTGDCGVRALAIASSKPYKEVYKLAFDVEGESPRNGLSRKAMRKILEMWGWKWTAKMGIGTGCTTHLKADELPRGTLILSLSGHYAAFVDGLLHDNHDCSRNGTRCVYGYWQKPEDRPRMEGLRKLLW